MLLSAMTTLSFYYQQKLTTHMKLMGFLPKSITTEA